MSAAGLRISVRPSINLRLEFLWAFATAQHRTWSKRNWTLGPEAWHYGRSSRSGTIPRLSRTSREIHFQLGNKGSGWWGDGWTL